MYRSIYLLIIILCVVSCSILRTYTLSDYRDKYGPPAKIDHNNQNIVWYYYYYEGEVGIKPGGLQAYKNYLVIEVIADQNSTVQKVRKYWMQPKGEPKFQEGPVDKYINQDSQ